jgi:transcriptional regulator with XRE-family HTH domain
MYGERLRALRKARKLTTQQVAEKLNIKQPSYSAYENEVNKPSFLRLKQFAELYNVSVDYIIGLTDNPDRDSKPKPDLRDFQRYIQDEKLHWNGRPLEEEELEPILKLLEIVIRDRMPKYIQQKNDNSEKK